MHAPRHGAALASASGSPRNPFPQDEERQAKLMPHEAGSIRIRGARTHNLHNVNLDLPRGRLIAFAGPSGSGKSSLAFDTLHAEGQRRFLLTLASEDRALFDQLQRPDVDLIDGLPPTLCVSQRTATPRPRSTLGT